MKGLVRSVIFSTLLASKVVLAGPPVILETPIILPHPSCVHCANIIPTESQTAPVTESHYVHWGDLYITGQYAYSNNRIDDIEQIGTAGAAQTAKNSVSERTSSPNIALGYQLWHSPFISPRVEVAYLPRIDLDYDANPFLQGIDSSINSSIDSHLILFKVYNDFEFCNFPLIPYIEGGIGRAWSKVESNSVVSLFPGLLPPFVGSGSDRRSDRAWDLGLGARYRFYRGLSLNLGYEYVFLGDNLKWNIVYSNPVIVLNPPVTVNLQSGNLIAHTFFAGLTWQPFAEPL